MKTNSTQYTIRNVPENLDARLRALSARRRKSLNKIILEQLESSLDKKDSKKDFVNHDFDDLFGSWEDDPLFDKIIAEGRQVDPKDWQ